ncbi:MAG: Xaa-Pro peptidase family protein [Candidatus Bathyarchaeota archaeon]
MKTGFSFKKTKELMDWHNIDVLVATSHDNVYYTSHSDIITITMLKRLAATIIPQNQEPTLLVHPNEHVTAQQTTWIKDLRTYQGGEWEPHKPIEQLASTLKEQGHAKARIAVETHDIPGALLDHLRSKLPDATFTDSQPILDKLRSIKSPDELKHLSKINLATAKAITAAFEMARPGDTEKKIARDMITLTLEYGADTVAFMTMGAGPNIHETHHIPGPYRLKPGDLIHVDYGCLFQGYLSDISRTAAVTKPTKTQQEAYDFTVAAQRATEQALQPGTTVAQVHQTVKQFYQQHGHPYTRPFIGHAIGIGCHEPPFLGPSHQDWVIQPGMFIQVEPSIATAGTRIHTEDSIKITTHGPRNVSEIRPIEELQIIN